MFLCYSWYTNQQKKETAHHGRDISLSARIKSWMEQARAFVQHPDARTPGRTIARQVVQELFRMPAMHLAFSPGQNL